MSKLTLSVEKSVVTRARRYARERGISVSKMVSVEERRNSPVLKALRGSLQKADAEDYRKHLTAKYR